MSPFRRSFRKKSKKSDKGDFPSLPSVEDQKDSIPHEFPILRDQKDSSLQAPPGLNEAKEPALSPLTPPLSPTPPSSKSVVTRPALPEPPLLSSIEILSRPPFPEPPHPDRSDEQAPLLVEDDLSGDILDELRQTGFSSILTEIPEEWRPKRTIGEVLSAQFKAAKEAYLAAAEKHLELDFYENAAMNYACAILCTFLGESVFEASHMIAKLATRLPPSIGSSFVFQGTKLLLKANLLNKLSYLPQAEKWLLKDTGHLFNEDIELIRRALQQSRIDIERYQG